jgi:uncharacterized delta-60 repeat protein
MKTNNSNLTLSTGKSLRFLNTLFLSADRRIRRSFGRGFAIGSVVVMLLVAWNAQVAQAADGALDPTFGKGGMVKTDFHRSNDLAYGMALQPDGKMVVAGISFIGISATGGDFAVARYNTDGTLDSSFGVGGKVTTDFGLTDQASSVVVQPDGKIIVAGGTYATFPAAGGQFALARYNSNGSLDTSFGVGGLVRTSFGTQDALLQHWSCRAMARSLPVELSISTCRQTVTLDSSAITRMVLLTPRSGTGAKSVLSLTDFLTTCQRFWSSQMGRS